MQQFQGYQPQQPQQAYQNQNQQTPPPQLVQSTQQVKFYKSGIFGFSSAAGRFQRDQGRMASQGWDVQHCAYLGTNFWLRRIICVVYGQAVQR